MVSILHGNIPWSVHYAVSGLRDSHMKVPDVVCADMQARIMILSELKAGLPHQGVEYQRVKKECIHNRLEINKNGYRHTDST